MTFAIKTELRNEDRRVLLLYFSGSGSTKAISEMFRRKLSNLGFKVTMVDLTIFTNPQIIDEYNFIIFGTPTYHCSPPKTVSEFIEKIRYQQKEKRIFIFATYGLYVGNNIRSIAKRFMTKNIVSIGYAGFRGPASDGTMMFPQWISLMYCYEKSVQRKFETAVKQIQEGYASEVTKQKIPMFKWYAPIDFVPNQIFARSKFMNVYRFQLELINDRWDGKEISCPRNCWTIKNEQAVYKPGNCEFCMRCIHRTPNKAVMFTHKMKDRKRLDENFYRQQIEKCMKR